MKKFLSIILSIAMLLSITAGNSFSAYANERLDNNVQVLTVSESGSQPIAILTDKGKLYCIQGVSGDGKQKAGVKLIAEHVKRAFVGYCGDLVNKNPNDYTKYGCFFILYVDSKDIMHTYYFIICGSSTLINTARDGKIFKSSNGPVISGVSSISELGYVKDKRMYIPYVDNGSTLKFKELKKIVYFNDNHSEKIITLSGKVKNSVGRFVIANKNSYYIDCYSSLFKSVLNKEPVNSDKISGEITAQKLIYTEDGDYHFCIAKGKNLSFSKHYNSYDNDKKIANDFKTFSRNGYYNTSGGWKSFSNNATNYGLNAFKFHKGVNVSLDRNGKLYFNTYEKGKGEGYSDKIKTSKLISNDVYDLYDNDFSFGCHGYYSAGVFYDGHANVFYMKNDGSFWSYDIYTKKATCILKREITNSDIDLAQNYTYNGKTKKPTVDIKDASGRKISSKNYKISYPKSSKNPGKYTITVKLKGNYNGTVKKTFTIKPKATSISKLTAGKKKFTVKWKKYTTQTTGYQIQYSTSSKFKSAKTTTISKNKTISKTISKLKAKKKYYVRVRTYKTVGKTKYYSSWSKVKSVTTKR